MDVYFDMGLLISVDSAIVTRGKRVKQQQDTTMLRSFAYKPGSKKNKTLLIHSQTPQRGGAKSGVSRPQSRSATEQYGADSDPSSFLTPVDTPSFR